MPREIPGMYYDEARGKYFKIQSAHHATPGSRAHTKAAVTQVKERKQEAAAQQKLLTETKALTVRRAQILRIPEIAKPFLRECGLANSSSLDDAVAISMRQLNLCETQHFPGMQNPSALVANYDSDIAIVGDHRGSIWFYSSAKASKRQRMFRMFTGQTQITSLSLTPRNELIWTAYDHHGFAILDNSNPDAAARPLLNTFDTMPDTNTTFFQSALSPNPQVVQAAFATNRGLLISPDYSTVPSRSISQYILQDTRHNSDVLAAGWLSPLIAIGGCRNGDVLLHDVRSHSSTVARLRHPSSVTNVRAIDQNRLLVAGLRNQMHAYDLRFVQRAYPRGGNRNFSVGKPWLSYPHYRKSARLNLGFDLSKDLGLIAAANEQGGVKLIGLWDGRLVEAGWDTMAARAFKDAPRYDDWRVSMRRDHDWIVNVTALAFTAGEGLLTEGITIGTQDTVETWKVGHEYDHFEGDIMD